jgi:hypothetical protein
VEQIGREGVLTMADGRRRAGSSLVMMEKENHMTRADDREAIAGESNFGDGKANLALEGGLLRVTFFFRQKKNGKLSLAHFQRNLEISFHQNSFLIRSEHMKIWFLRKIIFWVYFNTQ